MQKTPQPRSGNNHRDEEEKLDDNDHSVLLCLLGTICLEITSDDLVLGSALCIVLFIIVEPVFVCDCVGRCIRCIALFFILAEVEVFNF